MNSEEQFYIELGAKIASIRNDKNINQEVLAEFLKLSRSSVANIEKGRQRPGIITLALIANFLKVGVSDLIPGINKIDISDLRLRGADIQEEDHAQKESLNNFLQALRRDK
ncbi:helix-turn-helix domain-containing protein [Albibacterium indicum]|uniref:helix-turn-helix domain-containing protein n=1 Tax=Albibacterium indicum TaxID=2292082 RepID=UPI000E4E6C62|nr:helix-turn-helix transcriptional regulator [Pedobacter indicus]